MPRTTQRERSAAAQAALDLAKKVANGDRRAAEQLAHRVVPTVRRAIRGLMAGRPECDDAIQDALVEILRSAGNYNGSGTLEGWARRIATRVAMRTLRGGQASRIRHDDTAVEELKESTVPPPAFESLPRPLEAYLDQIPDAQRIALILRHAMGHTLPEIAELTDAPVPTVKSRILKAHETIARIIRRDLEFGAGPRPLVEPGEAS